MSPIVNGIEKLGPASAQPSPFVCPIDVFNKVLFHHSLPGGFHDWKRPLSAYRLNQRLCSVLEEYVLDACTSGYVKQDGAPKYEKMQKNQRRQIFLRGI